MVCCASKSESVAHELHIGRERRRQRACPKKCTKCETQREQLWETDSEREREGDSAMERKKKNSHREREREREQKKHSEREKERKLR